MYAFDELCDDQDTPFCYLLGIVKRMPRESKMKPEFFTAEFEWIMNVEDQAENVKDTQKCSPLIKTHVKPSAPLTLTPGWSPFPLAFGILPNCIRHGCERGQVHNSAFAIWKPELKVGEHKLLDGEGHVRATCARHVSEQDLEFENVHARHFFWLLEMTVQRAREMKKAVILAGVPGFSYGNAVANEMPAHSRLRLLQAGYLYPSRVPQAAHLQEQAY
ncbi:MAG TPA: hypothetical protein VK961_17290 [Chthoniobacter sp.]|nr:hypothetical protein [Chthoniobacter sp.]